MTSQSPPIEEASSSPAKLPQRPLGAGADNPWGWLAGGGEEDSEVNGEGRGGPDEGEGGDGTTAMMMSSLSSRTRSWTVPSPYQPLDDQKFLSTGCIPDFLLSDGGGSDGTGAAEPWRACSCGGGGLEGRGGDEQPSVTRAVLGDGDVAGSKEGFLRAWKACLSCEEGVVGVAPAAPQTQAMAMPRSAPAIAASVMAGNIPTVGRAFILEKSRGGAVARVEPGAGLMSPRALHDNEGDGIRDIETGHAVGNDTNRRNDKAVAGGCVNGDDGDENDGFRRGDVFTKGNAVVGDDGPGSGGGLDVIAAGEEEEVERQQQGSLSSPMQAEGVMKVEIFAAISNASLCGGQGALRRGGGRVEEKVEKEKQMAPLLSSMANLGVDDDEIDEWEDDQDPGYLVLAVSEEEFLRSQVRKPP